MEISAFVVLIYKCSFVVVNDKILLRLILKRNKNNKNVWLLLNDKIVR